MDQQPERKTRFNFSMLGVEGAMLALLTSAIAEFFLNDFFAAASDLTYFAKLGRIAAVFLTVFAIHRFASVSLATYRPAFKDAWWLSLVLAMTLLLIWAGRIITIGLVNYPGTVRLLGVIQTDALLFALPFATGALLLQAVLGLHYGLVFSAILTIIVGLYFPNASVAAPFVLVTTLVACLSLSRFRSRSAYVRAGMNVSLVAFPMALAASLVSGNLDSMTLVLSLCGALLSGILCAFIAAGVTPIIEYFGGYVTDMRLIEMATLDHPLLKELSIQAPGTWNHSMVIGMMVEGAAEAIGANPVLSRVSAYFHDIGKIKKPLYFVENQAGDDNRHDRLSPSMSALIIRSHVKEGLELAAKHKLPRPIADMIPQHHGTNRIEFFYDKACKEARENGEDSEEIDENLYRYPGPKPQTREAGLLMLADGIEAAARTLAEPTHDRIQGLVQKLINKVFSSGELDESDLTLRDLHLIAKSFTRVLTGIYHQRIAYAEPAEKTNEDSLTEAPAHGADASGNDKEREENKEDLKRLGL